MKPDLPQGDKYLIKDKGARMGAEGRNFIAQIRLIAHIIFQVVDG
ncbi:hypothetical protein [Trichocoleus sp. FACHB-90]|nr:hypothetical protein [Trichocoleus sp. FACHB-90]